MLHSGHQKKRYIGNNGSLALYKSFDVSEEKKYNRNMNRDIEIFEGNTSFKDYFDPGVASNTSYGVFAETPTIRFVRSTFRFRKNYPGRAELTDS